MTWDAVAGGGPGLFLRPVLEVDWRRKRLMQEKEVFLGLRVRGAASSVWMGVGSAVSTRLRLPF